MNAASEWTRDPRRNLPDLIKRRIREDGPISVADYMAICLYDEDHGYYRTAEPIGRAGDFITAPEVSQIFGELIGLWALETWRTMGAPNPLRLVELGPGRGTLMIDALRACRLAPDFLAALTVECVECSQTLQQEQKRRLNDAGLSASWHERLERVPKGPAIVIANEFFDALPIRQFAMQPNGWRERRVGLGSDGKFEITLNDEPPDEAVRRSLVGVSGAVEEIIEIRPCVAPIAEELARRGANAELAALIIDYGHLQRGCGDTLQAVRGHEPSDPLAAPGAADLTAHVDFESLARTAQRAGLSVWGPLTQGGFLLSLGLAERCGILEQTATPEQAKAIRSGAMRLVDPAQMGRLFKVAALTSRTIASLPGFAAPWTLDRPSAA